MKNIFLLVCISTIFSSCFLWKDKENDLCDGVNCGSGHCETGSCLCDNGYYQDADGVCTLKNKDLIIGSYLAQYGWPPQVYTVQIMDDPSGAPKIFIKNPINNQCNGADLILSATFNGYSYDIVSTNGCSDYAASGTLTLNAANTLMMNLDVVNIITGNQSYTISMTKF